MKAIKNDKYYWLILAILFILFSSTFCSLILYLDNSKPGYYEIIFLLPLSYTFAVILLFVNYKYIIKSISVTVVFGIYYIRMVIVPFIMYLGSYSSLVTNSKIYEKMDEAIYMMSYEVIVVCTAVIFLVRKFKILTRYNRKQSVVLEGRKSIFFWGSFVLIAGLFVGIILIYPDLIERFRNIIHAGQAGRVFTFRSLGESGEGILGIVDTVLNYLFSLLQIILPIILIRLFKLLFPKCNAKIEILYALFIAACTMMIANGEYSNSVFAGAAFIVTLCYIYPNEMKKLAPLMAAVLVVVSVTALLYKCGVFHENEEIQFNELSKIFHAYFQGPANIAAAISARDKFDKFIILNDLAVSIPFLSSLLFKGIDVSSLRIFNNEVYGIEGFTSQNIPFIGQSFLYSGFLLAPFLTCIPVFISVLLEKKAADTNNFIDKHIYIYGCFVIASVTGMNNFNTLYSYLFRVLICIVMVNMGKVFVNYTCSRKYLTRNEV